MNLFQAAILGAVEGLTEFLPVSSTGHLILAAHAMGLVGGEMNAFEIVIQAGALLAIVWLYRGRVGELLAGAVTPHPRGRALLLKLLVAFLPAAIVGLAAHHWIKAHLFGPGAVAIALVAGGIVILLTGRRARAAAATPRFPTIDDITIQAVLLIGLAQSLSLWPGTSRALTTILAALLLGASPVAAAEFSFLLALPTLGMATLFDLVQHYHDLTGPALGGPAPLIVGLAVSAIVAVLAIRGFLRYLTGHGLAPFGWYRIALGLVVFAFLWHHPGAAGP
ncbi:MAG: undecaprenyl-diphosphate phosphatase [Candidatus Eisenbacteria bacterium]|uniref:Undecaprenyl-diphosphatase n=1 Tax=Eiseniibacteriota bacterium TaxID=2212470 RepID=A0A538TPY4_UNCEI|nr:MAG: undecaprenyl-diphosphate phosphatase [Candidatus Eisenbacteria bacterium]